MNAHTPRRGLVYHPEILACDRLKAALHYDPVTGLFTWIGPPAVHPRLKGQPAGGASTGYLMIKIDGRKYKAHRLAWLYVHGALPNERIDHRDGDPFNNRISNLRIASPAQNCANARKWADKEAPKGVRQVKSGRFQARISFEKRQLCLGTFDAPEDAASAYLAAATRLYGEFARGA